MNNPESTIDYVKRENISFGVEHKTAIIDYCLGVLRETDRCEHPDDSGAHVAEHILRQLRVPYTRRVSRHGGPRMSVLWDPNTETETFEH